MRLFSSVLTAGIAVSVSGLASAQQCADSEYVRRFVSVDEWAVHGRNRNARYVEHFSKKKRDTVYVGYQPRRMTGPSWYLRFADDSADYGVDRYDVWWRQVRPSPELRERYRKTAAAIPCFSAKDLKRWSRPPEPHEVTYDDIIFAQMEPSYVTIPFAEFGLPKEEHRDLETNEAPQTLGLMYEAVIAPPFLYRKPKWPWSVAITPRVVLRQLSGGSAPVPPPSYMPRATFYYWGPGLRFLRGADPNAFPYAWFMFSHHSNGQEGDPVNPLTGAPNYSTGNFSTNFVEGGVSLTRSEPTAGFAGTQLSAAYYPLAWSDEHQRLYGRMRIRVAEEFIAPFDMGAATSSRFRFELTWMGGPMGDGFHTVAHRFNYSGTVILNPNAQDFATFVNWYNGQDYYNIRYDRRIQVIRLGVIATSLHFKFGVPKIP